MYVVHVSVRGADRNRAPEVLVYGPYKSRDKADDVRLALGERALSAPGKTPSRTRPNNSRRSSDGLGSCTVQLL